MTDNVKKILLIGDNGENDISLYLKKQQLLEASRNSQQRLEIDLISVQPGNNGQASAIKEQGRNIYSEIHDATAKDRNRAPNDADVAYAANALKNIERKQLSFHGSSTNNDGIVSDSHVTIISYIPNSTPSLAHVPTTGNHKLLSDITNSISGAEVDVLPLKADSKAPKWMDAGLALSKLAEASAIGGERNFLLITQPSTHNNRSLYSAKLENDVNVITDDIRALAYVKDKIKGDISAYPKEEVTPYISLSKDGELLVTAAKEKLVTRQLLNPEDYKDYKEAHGITKISDEAIAWKQRKNNTHNDIKEYRENAEGGLEIITSRTYEKYNDKDSPERLSNKVSPERLNNKLVIVVGDYGGGTVESALKNGQDISKLHSADTADARVLNEMIRQDPSVKNIITLPIARQFSPSSAGEITKQAVEWGFDLLKNPSAHPEYAGITEVVVVANVAPGIKTLSGGNVDQKGNNLDREAFVHGTVTKDGITIRVGSTNAFLKGEGHTLGALTELENDGYKLSEFNPIGGEHVKEKLLENGQFRSRWSLAYMAKGDVETLDIDVLATAREQHKLISDETLSKDRQQAEQVFTKMKDFVSVKTGDATKGFVTVITSTDEVGEKLDKWHKRYEGQFVNAFSYDGNETAADKKVIDGLQGQQVHDYRNTRQAFLAANAALEFDKEHGAGTRTVIVDTGKQYNSQDPQNYDVTLKNGSHIIASDPKVLAFAIDHIDSIQKDGRPLEQKALDSFLTEANKFKEHIANTAAEVDPYRNVKLVQTFGMKLQQVHEHLEKAGITEIPDDKAVAITFSAKTGDTTEERTVYYVPSSTGSFGIWGHAKLSAGSTILEAEKKKENYKAEIFTPGSPTAGADALFTVVPGVTQFKIESVKLIDKELLSQPGQVVTGLNRDLKTGKSEEVTSDQKYNTVHNSYIEQVFTKPAVRHEVSNAII